MLSKKAYISPFGMVRHEVAVLLKEVYHAILRERSKQKMAHFRKCTMSESVHLCPHYERSESIETYSNSEIDKGRSYNNYNLAPYREDQIDYIRHQLKEIPHVQRKDLVVMTDIIITAPKDLEDTPERFFEEAYSFCSERFGRKSGMGEDVVISAYVHMDETTPHMHFAFLPIIHKDESSRFCAKEVVDRSELRTFHKDLQKHMDSQNISCSILNGNTRYDNNGRALSIKNLKKEGKEWDKTWEIEW